MIFIWRMSWIFFIFQSVLYCPNRLDSRTTSWYTNVIKIRKKRVFNGLRVLRAAIQQFFHHEGTHMKKSILILVCLAACIAVLTTSAGFAAEKETIGITKIVAHPALDAVEKGIMDELAALGYDFNYDLQNANGELSTAASIANKFKSENVKMAIGITTPSSQALVNAIKDIPVIFTAVTDPVSAGIVPTLSKGDRNVCGVSDMTPVKEQIQYLNKLKKITTLGHVYSSHEENGVTLAKVAEQACKDLGIEFVATTISNSAEVKQAMQTIIDRVDGIYLSTDNTVFSALSAVIDVAMKAKKPIMSADPASAETNPILAAWGFNYYKMGRATGRLAAEVLKGKNPDEIPVRFMTDPSDVDLLLNMDVAEKLDIEVSEEAMEMANKLIKNGKLIER